MSAALFWQLVRYGITGIGSVAIYVGLLWVIVHVSPIPEIVANAAAYGVATLINYLANFYWSFDSKRTHQEASWRFLTVVAAGLFLNSIIVGALVQAGVRVELAALAFAVLWPIISFASLKLWALR